MKKYLICRSFILLFSVYIYQILIDSSTRAFADVQEKDSTTSAFVMEQEKDMLSEKEDIKEVNERLRFLWSQYMDMVNLLITLTTGTLAISAGLIKIGPKETAVRSKELFLLGMALLVVTLMFEVGWRALAQFFMEREVFGDPVIVAKYFLAQHLDIDDIFTTSYRYSDTPFFISLAKISQWVSIMGFILGITCLSLFAYRNIPEKK